MDFSIASILALDGLTNGAIYALLAMATVLLLVTLATTGMTAVYAVVAIGLFNSIMFPTIFSLASEGLGKRAAEGSGVIATAIVGAEYLLRLLPRGTHEYARFIRPSELAGKL